MISQSTTDAPAAPGPTPPIRTWLQHTSLWDVGGIVWGLGRWRLWLLIAAVALAIVAQFSFPPSTVAFDPNQPLPQPVWQTLLTLSGPFEPFRGAIVLYILSAALVILAFLGRGSEFFPGRPLNYLAFPSRPVSAESQNSAYRFEAGQWRIKLEIDGPKRPSLTFTYLIFAIGVSIGIGALVYNLFTQPEGASNLGLALWLVSMALVLSAAAVNDIASSSTGPSRKHYIGIGLGMATAVGSVLPTASGLGDLGLSLWSLGLVLIGAAWWAGRHPNPLPLSARKFSNSLFFEAALIVLILGVAIFFRFSHIASPAPGVNNDAAEGLRVALLYALGKTPYTPFSNFGWGFESLFIYYVALWTQLVQPPFLALRMAAVTIGVATIPAVYLIARRLGGPPLALITAALLASSGIHIVYSSVGLRLIIQPLIEALTFYFIWRAFDEKRLAFFLLAGLLLGLAINAHDSSRPDVVLYPLFVAFLFVGARLLHGAFLARYAGPLIGMALAGLVALAPIAGYAATHWDIYNARANFVFVRHLMDSMETAHPGSYWSPLARNIFVGTLVFNQRGNGNDFFVEDPAFDFPVNILLVLGLAYTLRYWRRPAAFFLLCWFAMGVATGFLSEPNANRTVGAVLPAYMMMAFFLLGVAELIGHTIHPWARYIALGAIALLLTGVAVGAYDKYAGPDYAYRWGYAEEATAVGAYGADVLNQPNTDVYVTTEYWVTDVMRVMTYKFGQDPYQQPYFRTDIVQALSGGLPPGRTAVFLFGNWQEEGWAYNALLQRYPGSALSSIPRIPTPWHRDGSAGYAVTIPPSALVAGRDLTNGLRAKFYPVADFAGDPYLNFVSRFTAFPNEPPYVPFSATWEGAFLVDKADDYLFHFRATNRAQLFIDGNQLANFDSFDIAQANLRHEQDIPLHLAVGSHTLRILYNYEGGDREVMVLWRPPGSDGFLQLTYEKFTPAAP